MEISRAHHQFMLSWSILTNLPHSYTVVLVGKSLVDGCASTPTSRRMLRAASNAFGMQKQSFRYTDGSKDRVCNGDRPKLLFDIDGVTPVALTTAAGEHPWNSTVPGLDNDQTYTLLRPVAQSGKRK